MPPAGTPSESSDDGAWIVPASLRPALAARYGPVLSGSAADEAILGLGDFASCGDRVTAHAVALGHLPRLGIVDYVTQRHDAIDPAIFRPLAARAVRRVQNPAGMLTDRLWNAVREMLGSGGGLLEVEGEEDLASLALVSELPPGATVIYGIPGEGVSFVRVDARAKDHVRELLEQMERRRVDLGG